MRPLLRAAFAALAPAVLVFSACTPQDRVVDRTAIARLDSTLKVFVDSGRVAGISAIVWEKGKERYFGAYGYADREANLPMARNTIVQIWSMTKPITGVTLMTLYDQGKFQLDDPIGQHVPELANLQVFDGVDRRGRIRTVPPRRPVTVRDFTRHTAGLAGGSDTALFRALRPRVNALDLNGTLTDFVTKLGQVPLGVHPEDRWEYGNSVDVQAALAERLAGVPYEQYLREHVLDPLGMRETRYFVPEEDRGRFAATYRRPENGPDSAKLLRMPDSTGKRNNIRRWPLTPGGWGLTSTIDDYLRFTRMLLNEGELDGVRILKPETVRLMATNQLADSITRRMWLPSKGRVGFGIDFAVRTQPPADSLENNGAVGEFFWDGAASTLFWVDPVNNLTAVLFVQEMPFDKVGLHKAFRDAVYGKFRPAN